MQGTYRKLVREVAAGAAALLMMSVAVPARPALAERAGRYTVKESTPAGVTPHFPAFDPSTGNVLVSNVAAGTVTEIAPGEGPVRVFPAGAETHTVVVDDDARRAYAVNRSSATVSVLDLRSGETVTSFSVGPQPHGIALDRRRERLYVTSIGADRLDVYDLEDYEQIGTIDVGDGPWGVDTLGRWVVVADTGATTLHLIDADELTVRKVIEVGQGPWNVKIGESDTLYATLERSGEVVAVNDDGEVLWRTSVGPAPHGLIVDESRGIVMAAVTGADRIAVIDSRTGRLHQSLAVADAPAGMAYDGDTGTAYAGAQGAGVVETIAPIGRRSR